MIRILALLAWLVAGLVPAIAQGIIGPVSGPVAPPGWVLDGANIDCDFQNQRYYNCTLTNGQGNANGAIAAARANANFYVLYKDRIWRPQALRISDLGLLLEEAHTNNALWSRDLTNAAWTASNVTTALDAVGLDGVASSASTLTATAGNGTVLQSITLSSTGWHFNVFVLCVTCTGNIQVTLDNSTFTTLSSSNCADPLTRASTAPNTSFFVQCDIIQTLANPTVGFRIANSGDSIVVDAADVGIQVSGTPKSPVFTTTVAVTRSADGAGFGQQPTAIMRLAPTSRVYAATHITANGFFDYGGGSGQNGWARSGGVSITPRCNGAFATSATIGNSANFASGPIGVMGPMGASIFDGALNYAVGENGTATSSACVYNPGATDGFGMGNNLGVNGFCNCFIERATYWSNKAVTLERGRAVTCPAGNTGC